MKTGYKGIGSVFRELDYENHSEEEQPPRERAALAGSHCAIKTVLAYTSSITCFTKIKMVLDLDEGHKAEKEQAKKHSEGESTRSFWFPFSIQQAHQQSGLLAVGYLGVIKQCKFLSKQFLYLPFWPKQKAMIRYGSPFLNIHMVLQEKNLPLRISGVLWQCEPYLKVWYFQLLGRNSQPAAKKQGLSKQSHSSFSSPFSHLLQDAAPYLSKHMGRYRHVW